MATPHFWGIQSCVSVSLSQQRAVNVWCDVTEKSQDASVEERLWLQAHSGRCEYSHGCPKALNVQQWKLKAAHFHRDQFGAAGLVWLDGQDCSLEISHVLDSAGNGI